MSNELAGQVAVVTGASKGIGASIAKHLAAAGAAVVVNYAQDRSGADRVVDEITSTGGKAIAVQANLAEESAVEGLMSAAHEAFGPIDILVNNAGVYEFAALEQITPDHFHRQFNLNVLGLLLATREAVKRFNPKGGSIVNVSSVVSTIAPPNSAVYSATKGAVDVITRSLAKELAPRKIRVNAVNPGMIETEGVKAAGLHESEMRTWVESTSPAGRIGQVDDISPAVVFLASNKASYIFGETLLISGGAR